jgi:hypothetical protein
MYHYVQDIEHQTQPYPLYAHTNHPNKLATIKSNTKINKTKAKSNLIFLRANASMGENRDNFLKYKDHFIKHPLQPIKQKISLHTPATTYLIPNKKPQPKIVPLFMQNSLNETPLVFTMKPEKPIRFTVSNRFKSKTSFSPDEIDPTGRVDHSQKAYVSTINTDYVIF